MKILLLGILTGFDNLIASTGFGSLGLSTRDRIKWVASFACFEAFMPLVGLMITSQTMLRHVEWLGPVCLIVCGLLVAWRVFKGSSDHDYPKVNSRGSLILVPFFLSLDNLAAGASLGASGGVGIMEVLLAGGIAAGLSIAGLQVGALASRQWKFNPQMACAICLISVGTLGMVMDF